MYSIGIDIGGTFTDFTVVRHDTGEVFTGKVLSTPGRSEEAVLDGLTSLSDMLPALASDQSRIVHASTLVTNAILERKGARTALLATDGFRDVLQTQLENRYNVYDLFLAYPEPIVPREHRYGVPERVYSDGSVATPLDEELLAEQIERIGAAGIEAVAVCYLHAYRNPDHERRTAGVLAKLLPEVRVSLSHEVNAEPREYERTSTTVLDAYVKPIVDRYLSSLETAVMERGYGSFDVMLSNGANTTTAIARRFPIQMIESGPAAGVEAAAWVCARLGIRDALSFDMGGTTAKLCLIKDGQAERSRKFEAGRVHRFVAGSGLPVTVPVYDLVEIGAGGGSIAKVDDLGLIAVGPESAGAEPGPVCYGRGGAEPTVTDADVVLGLIGVDSFLGGDMRLDREEAVAAILEKIGRPLGLDAVASAAGVIEIVNELMASAARIHIAEKGSDPSRLPLIAFGGAGPVHAIALARKLGCPQVVFPSNAGVMSAVGLLAAVPSFERLSPVNVMLDELTPEQFEPVSAGLRSEIASVLQTPEGDISYRLVAEMWFRGQDYPIEVPVPDCGWRDTVRMLAEGFRKKYAELYGRMDEEGSIELVNLRCVGERPGLAIRDLALVHPKSEERRLGVRKVHSPETGEFNTYDVLNRNALVAGEILNGPVVIQERETSFVLHANERLTVHPSGIVLVDIL